MINENLVTTGDYQNYILMVIADEIYETGQSLFHKFHDLMHKLTTLFVIIWTSFVVS